MKLTSVEIHPAHSSDVAVLSFRNPSSINPYNIKSILGLDADAIIPKHYGPFGSSKFYNLSLMNREVVLKIGLNPNFSLSKSYSDLRADLYRMISSSRTGNISLYFKNGDEIVAAISGFVSKFEAPLFEKVQEVQITITCSEPMLKSLTAFVQEAGSFASDILTVDDTQSTAPHGFTAAINITANIPSLSISDPDDDSWIFAIVPPGGTLLSGDIINFSSVYNDKYLYIIRHGTFTTYLQLADSIAYGSVWPIIFPGENTLILTSSPSVKWISLSHYPTYWGV